MDDRELIVRLAKRAADWKESRLKVQKETSDYWYHEYERLKHEEKQ